MITRSELLIYLMQNPGMKRMGLVQKYRKHEAYLPVLNELMEMEIVREHGESREMRVNWPGPIPEYVPA